MYSRRVLLRFLVAVPAIVAATLSLVTKEPVRRTEWPTPLSKGQ